MKEKAKISIKIDALESHWEAIPCRRLLTWEGRAREEHCSGASGEFWGCRLGVRGSTGLGAKAEPGMVEDAASAWPAAGTHGEVCPKAGSPGAAVVVVEGFSELRVCGFMVEPCGCSQVFPLLPHLCDLRWGHAVACYCCVWSRVPASVPRALGTSAKATVWFDLDFLRLLEVRGERYTCTPLKEGDSAPKCITQTLFPTLQDPNINVSGDQRT